MGNVLAKCCCGRKQNYVHRDDKKGKAGMNQQQPEQEETNVKVVTNMGGTISNDDPNNTNIYENSNSNKTMKTEDATPEKPDDRKKKKRKRKKKYWDSSSDDTTSSSSSSSDSGVERRKRSSRNKSGGTTTVYSKTIIGGNKITIGKNANIKTVNIGPKTVVTKEYYKPFTTKYEATSALNEERRLWNSVPQQAPRGCFINLREKNLVTEHIFNSQIRNDASAWVGMISFKGMDATCFRVGTKYVMTALHVIQNFLDSMYVPVRNQQHRPRLFFAGQQPSDAAENSPQEYLAQLRETFVVFNYLKKGQRTFQERDMFKLKPINSVADVPFVDEETDCIVLELEEREDMPMSFAFFSIPRLGESFFLITHSKGEPKHTDTVSNWLDPKSARTQEDLDFVRRESTKFLEDRGKDQTICKFDGGGYDTPLNEGRFLFHCSSGCGGSGSPGVVVIDDGLVIVVTMLLHGYPDWYYSPGCDGIKNDWNKGYCVEQGANMQRVWQKMLNKNPSLCDEIFNHTSQ